VLLNFRGSCSAEHNVVGAHAPFGCGADAAGQKSPVGQYENCSVFFFVVQEDRTSICLQ